jgi:probable phosphoglycerate mutase
MRMWPAVTVVRHGETDWSRSGQHTSRTDLDLTAEGEAQARRLRGALGGARFGLVLCSPKKRARRTAELAGLVPYVVDDDLREWDYGDLEGITTAEIRRRYPGWTIWDGPWPGGETPADVSARAERVVSRILDSGADRVATVGHGHFSRVLASRWVTGDVAVGRWLDLDTATVSELGWAREGRVIRHWNVSTAGGPG